MENLYSKWIRVFPEGKWSWWLSLLMHVPGTDSTKSLNFYLPTGWLISISLSTSWAFFLCTCHENRFRECSKRMDCQRVRQNSICQRVSGCTVASLLACWPPCSLSRAWFVPSRSCCTSALQKETHSTLYIIKFRTVTYTNLDYPMLLCNFARPHLSTPKVLNLSHAETENRCISPQQPPLGVHTWISSYSMPGLIKTRTTDT